MKNNYFGKKNMGTKLFDIQNALNLNFEGAFGNQQIF